ncbi:4-hydroxy-tetrahydrodipicolinate synthase [Aminobacter aganoensis]|uniref:4-hydroxy-tetrahydrodipicolinate synthase n=1 Tax=Aminobacter aganoensis TaxID=83264 RepID=A0A7X0F894_9HYPH|nr:4-hydroxy-tetrahydrodipicolinate synthase [Aminobacter aganoensis]MBB6354954.1 4-hydroxy-tetrahydrodipicolinate synthase [Aminobacter aganoensis]
MTIDPIRARISGALTALVTPFRDGEVDLKSLAALVDWQIAEGIDGLVVCGTTGEAPTLSWHERILVIRKTVQVAAGRVPVIVGTGTNSTESTIAFTAAARDFGADAALVVTPYYNKPSQSGMVRHFETVAAKVELPILVCNVPSRTGVDLAPATIERLAAIPGIVGFKDATGDLSRIMTLARCHGDRFIWLSGHDATAFGYNTMGGNGTISVVANIAPRLCAEMHAACRRGDPHAARSLHNCLRPLIAALELETNPVPVKHALHLLGRTRPDVRLPLVEVELETASAIGDALQAFDGRWTEGISGAARAAGTMGPAAVTGGSQRTRI